VLLAKLEKLLRLKALEEPMEGSVSCGARERRSESPEEG